MPRTPGAGLTHVEDTVDPTITDDADAAYEIGSLWTNTTTNIVFICTDAAVGAAVWQDIALTKARHDAARSLIHFISDGPVEGFISGAFRELLPASSPFPTSLIWWESAAKLKKIVEVTISYSGVNPDIIEWKMYDTDGSTVLITVTDTVSYSGVFETTRTRAIA